MEETKEIEYNILTNIILMELLNSTEEEYMEEM